MAQRTFLIVGATGKQGSAVLAALSKTVSSKQTASPAPKILALTRTATAAKVQSLKAKYPSLDLSVVEGDSTTPGPIFAQHPEITSVFSYTAAGGGATEEAQALGLIDAANAAGVSHFVFSSVDRGGEAKSWDNPTDIPHFVSKHNIELHLRGVAASSNGKLRWTILRPVAFMDNHIPTGFFSGVVGALMSTMPPSTRLQVVSVHDIGVFAAAALLAPDKWAGRAVSLAGDELTLQQTRDVFAATVGRPMPMGSWLFARFLRIAVRGDVGKMFSFFEREGYKADVAALRREEPGLQTFEMWLRESSDFEIKK